MNTPQHRSKHGAQSGDGLSFGNYYTPDEVLMSPTLTTDQKIGILEDWENELTLKATASAMVLAQHVHYVLGEIERTNEVVTGLAGAHR